jgi:hypothetical protein
MKRCTRVGEHLYVRFFLSIDDLPKYVFAFVPCRLFSYCIVCIHTFHLHAQSENVACSSQFSQIVFHIFHKQSS